MKISITTDQVYERFGATLRSVGERDARRVFMRALNRGGDQVRTQIRRSLVRQTGIKYGLINKAVETVRAGPNDLSYSLIATGNETNLSLFGARQAKKGVSAAPWKKRRIFKGAFIVPAYGGRVYTRTSSDRGPLKPLFGPNIARELEKDPTNREWHKAPPLILKRVEHELGRLFAKG